MDTNEFIIEIVKVLVSVLISTGILSIYFQTKLKRIGSYEKATETVIGNTLTGIEEVFAKARTVDKIIEKIESEIKRERPSPLLLRSYLGDLEKKKDEINKSVDTHRMYVTPLLELGTTDSYFFVLRCVELSIKEIIELTKNRSDTSDSNADFDGRKKIAQVEIEHAHEVFNTFCKKVEVTKKKVINGQPIY
jgi:hypothetical protein